MTGQDLLLLLLGPAMLLAAGGFIFAFARYMTRGK